MTRGEGVTVELDSFELNLAIRKLREESCHHYVRCSPTNPYRPERCVYCRFTDSLHRLFAADAPGEAAAALDACRLILSEIADADVRAA
jgi:hypothetical protein